MAITTANKTITFDQLMKVMKKYVGKSETRTVLKLVSFDGSHFVATNSHILLRVNAEYVSDIPVDFKLYDPKEMKINDNTMNFPDCNRLIPTYSDSIVTIDGNIKEFQQHVKEAKKIVKKKRNNAIKLEFKNNETWVTGDNYEIEEDYQEYTKKMNSMWVDGNEITLHVNVNYLDNALDTIKKLSKLSYNKVELRMQSSMRPIHFIQEGIFDVIVLPVRMV